MRHGSSVAPLETASEQVLHPVLEAALDSLDVELEEELTRYRRQKHRMARQVGYKQHIPTWKPAHRSAQRSSIDLPFHTSPPDQVEQHQLQQLVRQTENINRTLRQESMQTLKQSPVSSSSKVHSRNHRTLGTSKQVTPEGDVWADTAPPSLQADSEQKPSDGSPSNRFPMQYGVTPSLLDSKLATVQARSQFQISPSFSLEEAEEALTHSSALAVQPHQSGESSGFSDTDDSPEDYLESSEELLRSIAEETPTGEYAQETTLLDAMLSPLGIGSMLLLLLSTVTLGYVVMHPSSLDFLTAQEQPHPEPSDSIASPSSAGSSAFVPDSPNLAAEEFVDLNVNNLSTLPRTSRRNPAANPLPNSPTTGASPAPTGMVSPQVPQIPDDSSFSSYPSQPASESVPPSAPVPLVPLSSPSEPVSIAPPVYEPPATYEPPAAIDYPPPIDYPPEVSPAPPSPPGAPYYYVVTPYSGDPSLETAREAVPEAYVRNFDTGASVQLGAFSDPAKAEELVQQLESQGIPAEIYQP